MSSNMVENIQSLIHSNRFRINKAYASLIAFQYKYTEEFFESMSLYDYCLWKESRNWFCYALENDTKDLGYIGSFSNYKYGVFFSKRNDDYRYLDIYENEKKALDIIKDFLVLNVKDNANEWDWILETLRLADDIPFPLKHKIYYLYHPWKILPVYSESTLSKIMEYSWYKEIVETKDFLLKNLWVTKFLIQKYWLQELYTESAEKAIIGLYYFLEKELKLDEEVISISFHDNTKIHWIYLDKDNWDDFTYKTTYRLSLNEGLWGSPVSIGSTKIIGINPEIKNSSEYNFQFPFTYIWDDYCSFANHESFYIELKEALWNDLSLSFLKQINDLILKDDIFIDKFKDLEVFHTSLLRDQWGNIEYIRTCLKTYEAVEVKAWDYYIQPYWRIKEEIHYSNWKKARLEIDFNFTKDRFWFHRIHAIIWKNGIWKTTTLFKLWKLLTREDKNKDNYSWDNIKEIPSEDRMQDSDMLYFSQNQEQLNMNIFSSPKNNFSTIIGISYEAFIDESKWLFNFLRRTENGICCSWGSLVEKIEQVKYEKSNYFKEKVREVFSSENLNEINIDQILENPQYSEKLSSWYKVLLSTVLDIVINIKPNSLILFDEPETHLHPEFVSILIKMLYVLLDEFKSYMIIGTHSPIIIQQIPSKHITKIVNNWDRIVAKWLEIESFWNNLSEIIYDVFWWEQEDIFYKRKIIELKESNFSREDILSYFNSRMSLNLRIFLDTLYQ